VRIEHLHLEEVEHYIVEREDIELRVGLVAVVAVAIAGSFVTVVCSCESS